MTEAERTAKAAEADLKQLRKDLADQEVQVKLRPRSLRPGR